MFSEHSIVVEEKLGAIGEVSAVFADMCEWFIHSLSLIYLRDAMISSEQRPPKILI